MLSHRNIIPQTLWHDIPPSHIILTLSWPVLVLLNAECQAKEQLVPFLKSLVWPSRDQTRNLPVIKWTLYHWATLPVRRFSCSFISNIIIHRMTWRGRRRRRCRTSYSSLVWVFRPLWSFASPMRSQKGWSWKGGRRRPSVSSPLLRFVFCFRLISPISCRLRCMPVSGLPSIIRWIDYDTWIWHLTKVWL